MTDLNPTPALTAVPQLETNTLALGGTGNPMNLQAQALLNRDAYRADQIAQLASTSEQNLQAFIDSLLSSTGSDNVYFGSSKITDYFSGLRIVSGEFAGAVVDATDEIQQAIDDLPEGGTLDGRNLTYLVTKGFQKSNMNLINFRFLTKGGAAPGDFWSPVTVGDYGDTSLKENIYIYNCHVNGNRVANETGMTGGEDGGKHGFRFIGKIKNLTVENCSAVLCGSYGFFNFVGENSGSVGNDVPLQNNVNYINCKGLYNKAHGLAADSVDGLNIIGGMYKFNGLDMPGSPGGRIGGVGLYYGNGIDLEGYGIDSCLKNVVINGVDLRGNRSSSIFVSDPVVKTDPAFKMRTGFTITNSQMSKGSADSNAPDLAISVTPLFDNWHLGAIYSDFKIFNNDIDGNIDLICVSGFKVDNVQKPVGSYFGQAAYSSGYAENTQNLYFNELTSNSISYAFKFSSQTDANSNVNWYRREKDAWIKQGVYSSRVTFAANEEKTISVNYLLPISGNALSVLASVCYVSNGADVKPPVRVSAGSGVASFSVKNGATAQDIGLYCEIGGF